MTSPDPFRAWLRTHTRWGYQKRLAERLRLSTATLRNWLGGATVHAEHHARVIAAAKADGHALTPDDLLRRAAPND